MKKTTLLFISLFLLSHYALAQIHEATWEYKAEFESEFPGKYEIDEKNNAIVVPPIVAEFPGLTAEEILGRAKNFADKRVQLNANQAENANFSFDETSILLTEKSPLIKAGRYAFAPNYVTFDYTFKIEAKEGRARFSIALIDGSLVGGGFRSWPRNKYFKKQGRKAFIYFYSYAQGLISTAKNFIQDASGDKDEW